MPLPVAELRRGRICYAIYPFAAQFPLKLGDGTRIETIEAFAQKVRGGATATRTEVRLRPVLLLHDGTRGEHEDALCLRVNSVKAHHRAMAVWPRIATQEHPLFFYLPTAQSRHGLKQDSVIALVSVGTVHKSAILGPRHIGELSTEEMQIISERLTRVLSLDLAPFIAAKARELLQRAGFKI